MRTPKGTAVWLLMLCCLAAACGGGGGHQSTQTTPSGFFIGTTATGGDLSIAVGSIRAVFFRCGTGDVSHRFDPPEPVATDGSFGVDFTADGVTFTVAGEMVGDRIDGTIAGNAQCNGAFIAHRCNPSSQDCGDRDGDLIPNQVDPDRLCGNGVLDDGEECDQQAIDTTGCFEDVCTCEDFCDDAGGRLSCNPDCTLNFSRCTAGGCTF